MIHSTLADLRHSKTFLDAQEIIHIFDGRKKEEIGYFIPRTFAPEFESFLKSIEQKREIALLQKVALAQKQDPIHEGETLSGQ